jgi:chitodextrinase
MRLKTQLYIDTSNNTIDEEANYELVDFFDFETIEITETIKNIQEFDVVFTDYTKEFVVPANSRNNRIFQHYYSTSLINSFDARIKKRARIFINGIFFKQGYIRLTASKIKNGYPYAYNLTFFGALSGLGDVIGEDKLSDLDYLNRFDHEFNLSNVSSGLKKGLQYNGTAMEEFTNISRDIIYPLISVQNKWFYDGSGVTADTEFQEGLSVNIYKDNSGADANYGLRYTQLKPAIKVAHIFKAIDEKYDSINIKQDCFVYGSKLNELYLLLHNKKGSLSQGVGGEETFSKTFIAYSNNGRTDFDTSGADQELLPINTYTRYEGFQQARNRTEIQFDVEIIQPIAGDVEYTMEIFDGTTPLVSKRSTSLSGDSIQYELKSINYKTWDIRFRITSDGSVSEYDVQMTIDEFYETRSYSASISDSAWSSNDKTHTYQSIEGAYTFPQRAEIMRQVPDMKVIDFMTGIFKMFNLVAKVDDSTGEMDILPLNDYYLSGQERDITNYVDTFNYDIERLQLYGDINFNYEDASTFGLVNHNEIQQDNFGDLKFDATDNGKNNNFVFDKGKYDVKVPFEKLYFSRLRDENNSDLTNICEGWLVNEDQEPETPKPILFFGINTSVDTNVYKFGLREETSFISTYNRGSNSNSDGSLTINFGKEVDEYTLQVNENSLFNNYYSSYISNMFNNESRNLKIEGRLPLSFLFEYSLADRLIINGAPYVINEITTNLNTNKSQLDLITAFDINLEEFVDVTPPADVVGLAIETTLTDRVRMIWNQNIETDLAGYKVYVDGVLYATLGLQNNIMITGLSQSTSYAIKVTAYDEAGNESLLSSATEVTATTGSVSDVTSPTIPTNLRATLIGSNGFTVAWDASTDDTGVTMYKVYLDNVLQTPSDANTFYTFSLLLPDTDYSVTVEALDAANNVSARSVKLDVRTTDII